MPKYLDAIQLPDNYDPSILEAADMDEALAWARKAVAACRVPVEVREIFFRPRNNNQA